MKLWLTCLLQPHEQPWVQNHQAKLLPNSWFFRNCELINAYCFKLLNVRVIYTAKMINIALIYVKCHLFYFEIYLGSTCHCPKCQQVRSVFIILSLWLIFIIVFPFNSIPMGLIISIKFRKSTTANSGFLWWPPQFIKAEFITSWQRAYPVGLVKGILRE